jgi:L-cystine uptake protein TcyP (sodium:dicarboxylate symporter family)
MISMRVSPSTVIAWPTRFGAVTIPRPSERCQADPGVQKAVATLGATVTTVMGVLSCFTAGYWGQVSE